MKHGLQCFHIDSPSHNACNGRRDDIMMEVVGVKENGAMSHAKAAASPRSGCRRWSEDSQVPHRSLSSIGLLLPSTITRSSFSSWEDEITSKDLHPPCAAQSLWVTMTGRHNGILWELIVSWRSLNPSTS